MTRIVVIGGGASGLIAAIYAKRKDNEVIILERNNVCGKKILVTGNGRCNYFNENQDLKYYHSNNKELLNDIINYKNSKEILHFFNKIGINPRIKKGYYYPSSNQSSSVRNALLLQAQILGVTIKYNVLVQEVVKVKNQFFINPNKEKIVADKIILATGSKAAPKTGSDGIGYQLAQSFGHSIIDVTPALIQLKAEEDYLKVWNGVRCEAHLSLLEDNKIIQQEFGEVQLTDYGISGICTLNISSLACRGLYKHHSEIVRIDFLPFLDIDNYKSFLHYFDSKNEFLLDRNISQILEGILNDKLVSVILKKSSIDKNKTWNKLETIEKKALYQNLKLFELTIVGSNSFDRAQVCSGGIPLDEINTLTMESKKIKGLYLIGELLDVDGICGGYNLSFAWISGMLAGKGVAIQ